MYNYKRINNLTGWLAFGIAAVTYFLTIEPSASFWDCGEFIISAHKMEVGHPPGAPFFMILGHFFSLFAFGDVTKVALMVNILSALASAFTILFLFWSITHMAKRVLQKDDDLSKNQLITIIGSGLVGALAYTFSDTFWFSAVEGEVYATSSLFTALVFWAILKWEAEADQKYANRWLILIAYLMGLSIGVHLLNLLAIPAIVYIYYFKKYNTSFKGILYAGIISVGTLAIIMYGIVQGFFVIGSKFELLFVNSFKLPFFSGLIFYFLITFALLAFGIYYTLKKNRALWNTIFTMLTVILIGYSSFSLILIRSIADTPMNQNKPDDVFSLLGYLNREQYGDRPLIFGQAFNSTLDPKEPLKKESAIRYEKKDEKGRDTYKIVDYSKRRNYNSRDIMFFPRMYSDQQRPDHIKGYIHWIGKDMGDFYELSLDPNTKEPIRNNQTGELQYDLRSLKRLPTFGENLKYFFHYQLNYMYWRYFMWNFAGRQNDIQGHGKSHHGYRDVKNGNWISGISFIDNWRLGDQSKMPDFLKNNKGRNVYFFLPLLLGILGMVFLFRSSKKGRQYFWVILLFFFFTGIAIVLYLNQPPFQPRERDYAYAGSFYAFALYIGFGVAFLARILHKGIKLPSLPSAAIAATLSLFVPVLMAFQNWDDHDRSNRYTTTDYAKNYLSSCAPNAIIFTNGDNDTFPLWYVQEVEGFRTDVRVINLSYFNTDWYVNQMRKKAYDSSPVKFTLNPEQIEEGKRDVLYFAINPNIYLQEKYNIHKTQFEEQYNSLFDRLLELLKRSKFPEIYPKDFQTLAAGADRTDPLRLFMFSNKLEEINKGKDLGINLQELQALNKESAIFIQKIAETSVSLKTIIKHVGQESKAYKLPQQNGEYINYLPSRKFFIPVNKKEILSKGIVPEEDKDLIAGSVEWTMNGSHLQKNQMAVLDLLASNIWERPVYFASTVARSSYMQMENYFRLDGLAYRIVPIRSQKALPGSLGSVNSDILYDNLMNKFRWGGTEKDPDKIYFDENNSRFAINFKSSFLALVEKLIEEGKKEKAEKALDKIFKLFPNRLVTFNYYDLVLGNMYFDIDRPEKAAKILTQVIENLYQELMYYTSLPKDDLKGVSDDVGRAAEIYREAIRILSTRKEDGKKIYGNTVREVYDALEAKFAFSSIRTQMQLNALTSHEYALLRLHNFLGAILAGSR